MLPIVTPSNTEEALREQLYRSIARQCRGTIAVVGQHAQWFSDRIASRKTEARILDFDNLPPEECAFDTIVVVGLLEHVRPGQDKAVINRLAEYLSDAGRLIVCVPNEAFNPFDVGQQAYSESSLRRLLEEKGKVRNSISQPFMWILQVLKPNHQPSASMKRRYEITAELCKGRTLDLGCGPGHGTSAISDKGHDVLGFDMSTEKIAAANKKYPNLDLRAGDILNLPNDIGFFDTVLLAEVIEHVGSADGRRFLDVAWDLVAPDGRLVVSVPNTKHVPHKNHLVEFDWRSLRGILAVYGEPQIVASQPYKWLLMYVEKK